MAEQKSSHAPNHEKKLRSQDDRDTDIEFRLAGLVAEGVHPGKNAHASAENGKKQRSCFRNAPKLFACPVLVRKHKKKGCRIDNKEVSKEEILCHDKIHLGGIGLKKVCVFLLAMLLTACASQETVETVADDMAVPVMAEPREIAVDLPGEAEQTVVEGASGNLYLGSDYSIAIETLDAGDLDRTIYDLTGFHKSDLTVITTESDGVKRYEFVWAAAGEAGEQLGHGVILDDGNYHYCMSVLRPAETKVSQIIWEDVYYSFSLV